MYGLQHIHYKKANHKSHIFSRWALCINDSPSNRFIITFFGKNHEQVVGPQSLRDTRPGSIWLIADLTGITKLLHVLKNAHCLMQFSFLTLPNVANNFPMLELGKQMLLSGTVPTMHIIVLLLPVT